MRRRLVNLVANFLRGPWTPLRLTGVTFGLLIVVVAITGGSRFHTYVEEDPTFCRSCHTMEKAWTRWQTSEHQGINCHACHESSPIDSTEQIVKYVMNRPNDVRKHARVNDESCEKCHASGDPAWHQISSTAGHKIHTEVQRIACVKCHGINLHSFQPPAKVCLSCHGDEEVKMTGMAQRYCTDCHNYLRENSPLRPQRDTCLSCHENEAKVATSHDWPDEGPMAFQCSRCHQPHKQEKPEVNCQSCHASIKEVGMHAKSSHSSTSCTTCHKPHEWKVETRDACLACHGDKVEHNKGTVCLNCHNFNQSKKQT